MTGTKKRIRLSRLPETKPQPDPFEALPDDLVVCILSSLCHSSSSPSDFINVLSVCRRFNQLGLHPLVLSTASSSVFSIGAKNWSDSAHRFVRRCVHASSVEASYFLGMVRFYCLGNRRSGASLMAKAAIRSHAQALYSLAVIQFNGSGGTKTDKDLRAGAALCARAAYFGHVDALRELGHCLQDGYGVSRSAAEGQRLLIQANARELVAMTSSSLQMTWHPRGNDLLDPKPESHPTNRFMTEWFGWRGGSRDSGDDEMCSHLGCGRPETRPHEFRRCSACGAVKYCSRGCQARDWKLRHKATCTPAQVWGDAVGGDGGQVEEEVVVES